MEWLLLLGLIVVLWFVVKKANADANVADKLAREEQQIRTQAEQLALAQQQRQEEEARLSKIVTSSTGRVAGRRVIEQLRMVSVANAYSSEEAEHRLLLRVEAVGGNGAINVEIRSHRGGFFSAKADAVRLSAHLSSIDKPSTGA